MVPGIQMYQVPEFRRAQAEKFIREGFKGVESYHVCVYCQVELRAIQQEKRDSRWIQDHPYQAIFDAHAKPWFDWYMGITPEERQTRMWQRITGGAVAVFFCRYLYPRLQGL
jgi:hypothetical protein